MNASEPIKSERYTYQTYKEIDSSDLLELIDGEIVAMASPTVAHQRILKKLASQIDKYLEGSPCELFISPLDVRLNYDTNDDTVVQPDLFVVCDSGKITENAVLGAPDLVIEITSPSNPQYDFLVKYQKYLAAGVGEYWIIDPDRHIVHVYNLENGRYISTIYGVNDTIKSNILDGIVIDISL
jgi:Uma2 family endonuclease